MATPFEKLNLAMARKQQKKEPPKEKTQIITQEEELARLRAKAEAERQRMLKRSQPRK